ncbi:MAG: hypothetical protein PVJ75_08060 [Chloroflexota bacterium]|jgi:hypothetical protein
MKGRHLRVLALVIGLLLVLIFVNVVQAATLYDLRTAGTQVTINGAIFEAFNPTDPTGSGLFNPFVRISSNNLVIKGYNTDYRPLQFQENSSPTFTLARLLSEVPEVKIGGVWYREFQLDINQNKTANDALESLDDVELYESAFNDLCGYPFDGSGGGHAGCTTHNTAALIWKMDALEDSFVVLDYRNNEGSGKRDMRMLVPDSLFNQSPDCNYGATGCTVYLTIYSQFGGDQTCLRTDISTCPNNDGFEEWGVKVPGPTAITLQNVSANDGSTGTGFVIAAVALLALGTGLILVLRRRQPVKA